MARVQTGWIITYRLCLFVWHVCLAQVILVIECLRSSRPWFLDPGFLEGASWVDVKHIKRQSPMENGEGTTLGC